MYMACNTKSARDRYRCSHAARWRSTSCGSAVRAKNGRATRLWMMVAARRMRRCSRNTGLLTFQHVEVTRTPLWFDGESTIVGAASPPAKLGHVRRCYTHLTAPPCSLDGGGASPSTLAPNMKTPPPTPPHAHFQCPRFRNGESPTCRVSPVRRLDRGSGSAPLGLAPTFSSGTKAVVENHSTCVCCASA